MYNIRNNKRLKKMLEVIPDNIVVFVKKKARNDADFTETIEEVYAEIIKDRIVNPNKTFKYRLPGDEGYGDKNSISRIIPAWVK